MARRPSLRLPAIEAGVVHALSPTGIALPPASGRPVARRRSETGSRPSSPIPRLAERSDALPEEEIHLLDEAIEALSDAEEGGQRVARIVRDLATFANPDPHRSRLRLADVVIDAMRWLPATVAKTATVEVVDDGVGIGPDVLDRIFDPFFTTRAVGVGRGSGLGLALSRSIVEAHGGTTTVESEPGKGSTFRVEVPAAPDEA